MANAITIKQPGSSHGGLDLEARLWAAADKLRGHMDASECKQTCLGLSFRAHMHPDLKADFVPVRTEPADPPLNWNHWGAKNLWQKARWKFGMPPADNANSEEIEIR
jgi:type I restriction enzyme M protein